MIATTPLSQSARFEFRPGLWAAVSLIRAATYEAARCTGTDQELGSVEVGKRADLLLVRGDSSADITALRGIEAVMIDGRLHDREAILEEARRLGGGAVGTVRVR